MDDVTARPPRSKPRVAQRAATARSKRRALNLAGRPTATELERRKGKVIAVATRLFVSQGYAATSLVDIARGAGVATRTVYQHFGDKEAMFREVILARDSIGAIEPPGVQDGDTLESALRRAARYACGVAYREQSVGLMRLMIAESARFPDFMQGVARSIFARFLRNFEKVFEKLEAGGLIDGGGHARSAELFTDLILGSNPIMIYTDWDATAPSDADVDERVELFIRGRFPSRIAAKAGSKKLRLRGAV
jgi:AcrR family transcriptional regulator